MYRPLYGINVDTRRIAEGVYAMFNDQEAGILCNTGMLPAGKMEVLESIIGEKFDEIARQRYQDKYGEPMPDGVVSIPLTDDEGGEALTLEFAPDAEKRKRFVSETVKQIIVDIMAIAPMRV